jgi:hypothetical protein
MMTIGWTTNPGEIIMKLHRLLFCAAISLGLAAPMTVKPALAAVTHSPAQHDFKKPVAGHQQHAVLKKWRRPPP